MEFVANVINFTKCTNPFRFWNIVKPSLFDWESMTTSSKS